MLNAKTITNDCFACPASWSGMLNDGRHWRARYRWGTLRFSVDNDPNRMSVFSHVSPEILEEMEVGDEYDGSMSYEEMVGHLSNHISFSQVEWINGE